MRFHNYENNHEIKLGTQEGSQGSELKWHLLWLEFTIDYFVEGSNVRYKVSLGVFE